VAAVKGAAEFGGVMAKSEESQAADAAKSKATLEKAREKFTEVAERARRGGNQVKASASRAGEVAKEKASRAGEVAKEKYGVAVDNLKQGYDKVHTDMSKLTEDVNDYVRSNPGRSILMAAGLGFMIGLVMRGRRR
jgi:ElaB/YqjD/DUF883 family membrane-anchored ribosome-binding protein